MAFRAPILLLMAALVACAPLPRGQAPGAIWTPSPNFDLRRPNFIILHQTTNATAQKALATLTDPFRKVSAHYLIARDGTVHQLVDEAARAWHAGESWWGGNTDLNSSSIGIELDNTGDEAFAEPQVVALLALLDDVTMRHRIPRTNVLGHGDVAPVRKSDPSSLFPWERLARQGFGLWCDQPPPSAPVGFDALLGLQALGYDISAPEAARSAFRRHFTGGDADAELTSGEAALLHCLVQQKISGATEGVQVLR